jgi:D-alanyl-D-alanine carboxypeptidase (penicillin-binding protein 5/6)
MSPRRLLGLLTASMLLATAIFPAAAGAAVRPDDLVGGVPVRTSPALADAAPDLQTPAAILVTMDGRELWARNPAKRHAMASITKVMTAVVVLERADLDAEVKVTASETKLGESDAKIRPGDELPVRRLLEAMMVKSANEAAEALAVHTGGSVRGFVTKMNDKAAELGLADTHFDNPHGLDSKEHYTTPRDLSTLGRYAMNNPEFRRMVKMPSVTLTGKAGTRTMENSNQLLKTFPGAEGIKTGWTDDAGYSLMSAAKRGDVELVAVVLGTPSEGSRFVQSGKLLAWGFKHYKPRQLATAGTPTGAVPVTDYLDRTVPVAVAETTSMPVFDLAGPITKTPEIASDVSAPVKAGQRLGTLTIAQGDTLLAQVPLVATRDVPAPGWWEAFTIGATRTWRGIFGGPKVAPAVAPPATL